MIMMKMRACEHGALRWNYIVKVAGGTETVASNLCSDNDDDDDDYANILMMMMITIKMLRNMMMIPVSL